MKYLDIAGIIRLLIWTWDVKAVPSTGQQYMHWASAITCTVHLSSPVQCHWSRLTTTPGTNYCYNHNLTRYCQSRPMTVKHSAPAFWLMQWLCQRLVAVMMVKINEWLSKSTIDRQLTGKTDHGRWKLKINYQNAVQWQHGMRLHDYWAGPRASAGYQLHWLKSIPINVIMAKISKYQLPRYGQYG